MRQITLRHLRTVQAICRHGKIIHAARELGLTSPAVTLQVQQIEEEAGGKLFLRTRSGMKPTEIGLAFFRTAQAVFDELSGLEDAINAIKDIKGGTLRLGAVSTGKYFAPRLMAAFQEEWPDLNLTLQIANRSRIIDELRNHEIDIALMGRPPDNMNVRSVIFGDHPLVFIAAPIHPLAMKIDISKEELAREKLLIREKGSGTRSALEIFMSDVPGLPKPMGNEMDSNETIKQAVMAGLGIAFISGHAVEQECRIKALAILDVVETPIRRQWFCVSNMERKPTAAMAAFETFLRVKGMGLLPNVSKPYRLENA